MCRPHCDILSFFRLSFSLNLVTSYRAGEHRFSSSFLLVRCAAVGMSPAATVMTRHLDVDLSVREDFLSNWSTAGHSHLTRYDDKIYLTAQSETSANEASVLSGCRHLYHFDGVLSATEELIA